MVFQHHQAVMRNKNTVNCKTAKVVKASERRAKDSSSTMRSEKNCIQYSGFVQPFDNHLLSTWRSIDCGLYVCPAHEVEKWMTLWIQLIVAWSHLWALALSFAPMSPSLWLLVSMSNATHCTAKTSSTFTTTLQPAGCLACDGCSLIVCWVN